MLIDTNIAIYLRDVDPTVTARVKALRVRPRISMMTWVELEGGVHADPITASRRRSTLDLLLQSLEIEPVDAHVIAEYGRIVAACRFSRLRVMDRLIAATAIVHDLTLVTMNGSDFHDIPDLRLEVWHAAQ